MSDFPWHLILWWAALIGGLAGTTLLSGLETGIYCLNRVRLALRAAHGPQQAAAATIERELRRPEQMLAANLIANLICGDLAATGASRLLAHAGYSEHVIIIANVLILTPVFFVLVESVPKELFRLDADRLTYHVAWVLPALRWILTIIPALPLVLALTEAIGRLVGHRAGVDAAGRTRSGAALDLSARERVANLIKDTASAGGLSESQAGLVDRVMAFHRTPAAAHMRPWSEIATVSPDATLGQLRDAIRRRDSSWIAVAEPARRPRVLGVIWYADAYLRPGVPIRQLVVEPARFAPRTPLAEAMAALRRSAAPVGIVEDAGHAIGLVTNDDLTEPLVERDD